LLLAASWFTTDWSPEGSDVYLGGVILRDDAGNALRVGVYADGENVGVLGDGERVTVSKSAATAKLVELEGYDPYGVLARKLGWSGSNVS